MTHNEHRITHLHNRRTTCKFLAQFLGSFTQFDSCNSDNNFFSNYVLHPKVSIQEHVRMSSREKHQFRFEEITSNTLQRNQSGLTDNITHTKHIKAFDDSYTFALISHNLLHNNLRLFLKLQHSVNRSARSSLIDQVWQQIGD